MMSHISGNQGEKAGDSSKKSHLLVFLAVLIVLSHQAVFLGWASDDAFISFRYAENLIRGEGLVFNPGERVEGFSNFSWVLLVSLFKLLGIPFLWAARGLSAVLAVFLVILLYRTVLSYGWGPRLSGACAVLAALPTSLAYYAMSGLETVFYAFLITACVYLHRRFETEGRGKFSFLLYFSLFLAALTRPEGILIFVISFGYLFFKSLIGRKDRNLCQVLAAPALFSGLYFFLILIRFLYYSDILPNTFYAKPHGTFVEYGFSAFTSNFVNGFLSGTFLLALLIPLLFSKSLVKEYAYPLLVCGGLLVFVFYSGDWMAFGRFFLPAFPLAVLLSGALMRAAFSRISSIFFRRASIAAGVLFVLVFGLMNIHQTRRALVSRDLYPYTVMHSSELIEIGRWIRENYPAGTVIATRRQGAVPYYSQMRSLDILGITDKKIARVLFREKKVVRANTLTAEIILNRDPDLIVLFSSKESDKGWLFDRDFPHERLIHVEHLIFEEAKKRGFVLSDSRPFGADETVIFLERGI